MRACSMSGLSLEGGEEARRARKGSCDCTRLVGFCQPTMELDVLLIVWCRLQRTLVSWMSTRCLSWHLVDLNAGDTVRA